MMKILFFAWKALNEALLIEKLKEMNLDVEVYNADCSDYMFDGDVAADMLSIIHSKKIEAVVSFDYIPLISLVCSTCNIKYYSWGYDAPQLTLFAKTAVYDCNHIGVFDRRQAEFLTMLGYKNVYHVPLAVDVKFFENKLMNSTCYLDKFADKGYSDVSFVGSMYTDERKCNLYNIFKKTAQMNGDSMEGWNELDSFLNDFLFDYSKDLIYEDMEPITEFLSPYMKAASMGLGDNYFEVDDVITRESILEKYITSEERKILMTNIADECKKNNHQFALYTTSDTSGLGYLNECNRGPVDYEKVMPKVFNRSKINIHITLRSIHTGIPLRALDVLACGGFLLTNGQEEIKEYFEDGVHLAIYNSVEECIEKINYYLSHEEKRKQIALNGKKRVTELFSYEQGIKRLLESV